MIDLESEGPRTAKYLRSLPKQERMKLRIPKRYADVELDELDVRSLPAVPAVQAYAQLWGTPELDSRGLRLIGPSGRGKSVLAAALLRYLVSNHPISGAWCSTRTFLDMVMAEYGGGLLDAGFKDPHSLLYIRRRYDVLVLDGLGEERRTASSDGIIHELLRDRGDQLMPTIITTYLTMAQIKERYGEACGSYIERTTIEVAVF